MSEIFGLFHRDGRPARRDELTPFLSAGEGRGPDGTGVATSGPVAMGCLRRELLSPEREAAFPLAGVDGSLLVASCRLDGRDELRRRLGGGEKAGGPAGGDGADGHGGRNGEDRRGSVPGESDGELLFAAWRRFGEAFAEPLRGDFALALWDPGAQRLLLARDGTGLRRLYLWRRGETLVFSSFVAGIRALPGWRDEVDPLGLASLLSGPLQPVAPVPWRGIERLPCGFVHAFGLGNGGERRRRFWELPEVGRSSLDLDETVDEARRILREAVAERLPERGEAGLLLSGGLDSSACAALAADLLGEGGRRLVAASHLPLTVPAHVTDERPLVEALAAMHPPLDVHPVASDPAAVAVELDEAIARGGGAPDAYHAAEAALYRALADRGVRGFLHGAPGDGTLSWNGAGVFDELSPTEVLRLGLCAAAHHGGPRASVRRLIPSPLRRLAARLLGRGNLEGPAGPASPWLVRRLAPLRRAMGGRRRRGHRHGLRAGLSDGASILDGLGQHAGAFGLEALAPLMDRELVSFFLEIPARHFVATEARGIFRRAFGEFLPPAIATRGDKTPFHPERLLAARAMVASFREHMGRLDGRRATRERLGRWLDLDGLSAMADALEGASPPRDDVADRVFLRGSILLDFVSRYGIPDPEELP